MARSAINRKLINEEYVMLCKYGFLNADDYVLIIEMSPVCGYELVYL